MNASVDHDGKKVFVKMGSYGVGVSRLVGAIIEAKFDEKNENMNWPINIAPYECAILPLTSKNDKKNLEKSINLFKQLKDNNIDAIIDDTDENLSSKMKKFNLIGIPYQIILGKKTDDDMLEFKKVGEESTKLNISDIIKIINSKKEN
jgi:Prolyl-tRNA synthetase